MRQPEVGDYVRLTLDIPNLWLQRGETGIVCATPCGPIISFEVEFHPAERGGVKRALVPAEKLEIEEESLFQSLPYHPGRLTVPTNATPRGLLPQLPNTNGE